MSICAKPCFICGKPEGNFDCLEQGCDTGRNNLARKEHGMLQDLLSGKTAKLNEKDKTIQLLANALKGAVAELEESERIYFPHEHNNCIGEYKELAEKYLND